MPAMSPSAHEGSPPPPTAAELVALATEQAVLDALILAEQDVEHARARARAYGLAREHGFLMSDGYHDVPVPEIEPLPRYLRRRLRALGFDVYPSLEGPPGPVGEPGEMGAMGASGPPGCAHRE